MIRIGLYGANGHQLPAAPPAQVRARVAAVADYPSERLDEALGEDTAERRAVKEYRDLEALLADPEIDLVSLCSAWRRDEAGHALQCLRAGKHVLAEKPGAFTDEELDRLLETSAAVGKEFREMNDSMLQAPIQAIRKLADDGDLGVIVHVQAHKSYPWHERRPQDFDRDGGLVRQAGIHGIRFIIAASGQRITSVAATATNLGNPGAGQIHIAAALAFTLENGGVASLNLNYLNPPNFGAWGNEQIRVFGTRGMAESVDGFRRHRLYLVGREQADLPMPDPPLSADYLEHYVNHLLDGAAMPTSREEEVAALRATIAAHWAALRGERVDVKL